jgi:hypothetical protein
MASMLKRPSIDIESFINKGGSSSSETPIETTKPKAIKKIKEEKKEIVTIEKKQRGRPKGILKAEPPLRVEMRIPPSILDKIDAFVETHPLLTSRHAWLLQAIYEKIEKDTAE